jgi:hypothetical protein
MPGNLFEFGVKPQEALGELLWLVNNSYLGIPESVGKIQGILPGVIDARDDNCRLYLGNPELALSPFMHETIMDTNSLDFRNSISGMVFMSASGVHLAVDETDPTAVGFIGSALIKEVDSVFTGSIKLHGKAHTNFTVVGLMREAANYTRIAMRTFRTRRVLRDAFSLYVSRASIGFPMYVDDCFETAEFAGVADSGQPANNRVDF